MQGFRVYVTCHCCSVTKSCPSLCDAMNCSTPGFPVLRYLPVCSNSCPLSQWYYLTISSSAAPFSFCLQSFPSSRSFPMSCLFASGGQKYWSFSISPSNECLGLISFRIDWFDLLAVQGTLKSLFQHRNFRPSVLWLTYYIRSFDGWKDTSFSWR